MMSGWTKAASRFAGIAETWSAFLKKEKLFRLAPPATEVWNLLGALWNRLAF